jgi:phthalate 4,5-dioxygenase oxygenase subunit
MSDAHPEYPVDGPQRLAVACKHDEPAGSVCIGAQWRVQHRPAEERAPAGGERNGMLSTKENELLTQTGPGTPMGETFRRFWLPAMLSTELPAPDCTPVRFRLLGEDLIAFRDSQGRPGILDRFCPHRGADMFFGRNEEDGLRCVYHGWKFDVAGACLEVPNVPEGSTYKDKVRIPAYPAWERAGIVWCYMGPPEHEPPKPAHEWIDLQDSHRYLRKYLLNCNFMQGEEGDFDASHAQFLHSTLDGNRSSPSNAVRSNFLTPINSLVQYKIVEDRDYGVMTVTEADRGDGTKSVNVGHWFMPASATAGIAGAGINSSNMRIPIDDTHCYMYRLRWSDDPIPASEIAQYETGGSIYPEQIPGTFVAKENIGNDYMIDRLAQRHYSYSGIKSFPIQDLALIENQRGPLQDRSTEHLVSSDEAIIRVRRHMLKVARDLLEGVEPAGANNPESYRVRAQRFIVPSDMPLEDVLSQNGVPIRV